MNLTKNLRTAREKCKYTQREVAEKLHCAEPTYSRYETGHREPSIETLINLAELFGVSVDFIIGRTQIEGNSLSDYEEQLVEASRKADPRACEDALSFLKLHDCNLNS